jgi:hypothetical protein
MCSETQKEKKMNIINLTPHPIVLLRDNGLGGQEAAEFTPSGVIARVATTAGVKIEGKDIPLFTAPTWGEVENLPAPQMGVILLVSALVAGRCIGRTDVFSPGTGPNDGAVRDDKGHIKAVTRLIQAPQS